MKKNHLFLCFIILPFFFSCNKKESPQPEIEPSPNGISAPPSELGLDPFYQKYLDAGGIPVISSGNVPDEALLRVKEITLFLFDQLPEARQYYIQNQGRIGVMADEEVTTDIPEHSDLNDVFPGTDWDTRARGLGATLARPITTCAEENVLCYTMDVFQQEDILVHELTHGIHLLGWRFTEPGFDTQLQQLYDQALSNGLWENTYAASTPQEYLAEGVQSYFNVNAEANPANGIHNFVNTREELAAYDPDLFTFIKDHFPDDGPVPSCH